jgi:hypothetical protein
VVLSAVIFGSCAERGEPQTIGKVAWMERSDSGEGSRRISISGFAALNPGLLQPFSLLR